MSEEKQIEEMAVENLVALLWHNTTMYDEDQIFEVSEALVNAGYRKQSEAEWRLGKSGCIYSCSCCGYLAFPREEEEWNFCPICGAKMKGGAE